MVGWIRVGGDRPSGSLISSVTDRRCLAGTVGPGTVRQEHVGVGGGSHFQRLDIFLRDFRCESAFCLLMTKELD